MRPGAAFFIITWPSPRAPAADRRLAFNVIELAPAPTAAPQLPASRIYNSTPATRVRLTALVDA